MRISLKNGEKSLSPSLFMWKTASATTTDWGDSRIGPLDLVVKEKYSGFVRSIFGNLANFPPCRKLQG